MKKILAIIIAALVLIAGIVAASVLLRRNNGDSEGTQSTESDILPDVSGTDTDRTDDTTDEDGTSDIEDTVPVDPDTSDTETTGDTDEPDESVEPDSSGADTEDAEDTTESGTEQKELIPGTSDWNAYWALMLNPEGDATKCKYYKSQGVHISDGTFEYEAASCLHQALTWSHCMVCGVRYVASGRGSYGEHDWVLTKVLKEATCTEKGKAEYVCSVCGRRKTEYAVDGHVYGEPKVTKKATCTKDGVATLTCTKCGYTKTDYVIPAIGHDYRETKREYNDQCKGCYATVVCTRCGDTKKEERAVRTCMNDAATWVLIEHVDPQINEYGYDLFECSRCKHQYQRDYSPLPDPNPPHFHDFTYKETVLQEADETHDKYVRKECSCGDSTIYRYTPEGYKGVGGIDDQRPNVTYAMHAVIRSQTGYYGNDSTLRNFADDVWTVYLHDADGTLHTCRNVIVSREASPGGMWRVTRDGTRLENYSCGLEGVIVRATYYFD